MTFLPQGTLLVLSTMGVPLYSCRAASQTMETIAQSQQLERTINAELVDMSDPQFRKYKSTITVTDQRPFAFDKIWAGITVTVDCVFLLSYKTAGGTPSRTVVPGSSFTEGDFTFYRPRLTMKVVSPQQDVEEWAANVKNTMTLEEV